MPLQVEGRLVRIRDPIKGHASEFVFERVLDAYAPQEHVAHEVRPAQPLSDKGLWAM